MEQLKNFGYLDLNKTGERVLTKTTGEYAHSLMNISSYKLQKGDKKEFYSNSEETALLLIYGKLTFKWQDREELCERKDFFTDDAYCLHFPKGVKVTVEVACESELLVQSTKNDKDFTPVFYKKGNFRDETFGQGLCSGVAVRRVTTFFDYDNAPYSNMVMGEIMSNQGGWSSYVPHSHRQPEVYYYRFDHPNGFGACFIGDEAYKATDGSFCVIPGGLSHPQVSAPAYRMYYVWMIRHFDGDPWNSRDLDAKHEWILKDKKFNENI